MTRLCTEGLCSYSGRSDSHAGNKPTEKDQMAYWKINPRYITSPSFDVSEIDGTQWFIACDFLGNYKVDESEVSRGHSSPGVSVMAEAWRRAKHFTRGRLLHLSFTGGKRRTHS
jgi:hypothetical protein